MESWTGEEGTTALQKIPGLEGIVADVLTIEAVMEEDEWIAIAEVFLRNRSYHRGEKVLSLPA